VREAAKLFAGSQAMCEAGTPRHPRRSRPGLATLQGHEVVASMGRIVAMVGDGHTYLEMPASFRRYPIRLQLFGDTLRITHLSAEHAHLLGGRVVAIGATAIGDATRLVGRQIAQENAQYVRKELPFFLTQAELLHAHGVVRDVTHAEWTLGR
jgi:hypothetical protein